MRLKHFVAYPGVSDCQKMFLVGVRMSFLAMTAEVVFKVSLVCSISFGVSGTFQNCFSHAPQSHSPTCQMYISGKTFTHFVPSAKRTNDDARTTHAAVLAQVAKQTRALRHHCTEWQRRRRCSVAAVEAHEKFCEPVHLLLSPRLLHSYWIPAP